MGLLIKDAAALEQAGGIDVIILDKTGTLTIGRPAVTNTVPNSGFDAREVLMMAASLEQGSQHPLAEAILRYAASQNIVPATISDFNTVAGKGVSATYNNATLYLGSLSFLGASGVPLQAVNALPLLSQGKTVIGVGSTEGLLGLIAIADPIRDDSAAAVQRLQAMGIDVVMLTGDNPQTADAIAKQAGISQIGRAHV